MRTVQDVLNRLRAEYLEMPGLVLKPEQVQRLCGLERAVCQTILDALVEDKFLRVTSDGQYARLAEGNLRPRTAKANLRSEQPVRQAS
jgi:hypothetical protein